MKGLVLIPAYKPNEELVNLIERISARDLRILVIDDGSGDEFLPIFEKIQTRATVLSHPSNMGKGYALKTGIRYVREHYADYDYFITADSDGQHSPEDIFRMQEKLETGERFVLSMRKPQGKVPLRSRVGNTLSSFIYAMLTGKYYADNQSGLRGFAVSECDWLLQVQGDRYDYELNVIYYADRQKIHVATLNIEAIYIDGNKSSHFNPIGDTLRIYRQLFSNALGTLLPVALLCLFVLFSPLYLENERATKYFILGLPLLGIVGFLLNVILTKLIFLKRIQTKDYGKVFLRTLLRFLSYAGLCYLGYSLLPLSACALYFLALLLLIFPEYWLVKLCNKIAQKRM